MSNTSHNYLIFHNIKDKLTWRARQLAGGCQYTADELLAEAADIFVLRCQHEGTEAQVVSLARLCLLHAARTRRRATRHLVPLDDHHCNMPDDSQSDLATKMQIENWSATLDQAIGQWGCNRLRAFYQATQDGKKREDAAAEAGMSQVEVTRVVALLRRKLTGRSEATYRRRDRAAEVGQLDLFSRPVLA